ncbi:hypothetical protein [Agromyces silvae]|uniref:hypothetical protein n=1 Tax=Agromyces silvae TaxID=3388266 RepID=UPI00280AC727|nr:hypothetical protein [Agromyces protaetiae]
MGDDLTVSVGGGSRVALDELFAEAAALGALEGACRDWRERAAAIRRGIVQSGVSDAPGAGSWGPASGLSHASSLLETAAWQTQHLRAALVSSAEEYGRAERTVTAMWDLGARYLAANTGLLALFALPFLVVPGMAIGAVLARAAASGAWNPKASARAVLSDPDFVRLVRSAGGAADEFLLGLRGLPPSIAMLLGAGVAAPENASLLLGAAGGLGLFGSRAFVDGPVAVRRDAAVGVSRVPPPAGVGDIARRVPAPAPGAAQIRVERYGPAAAPRWLVYVGGTLAASPVAGAEPLDLTSDVHAIADDSGLDRFRVSGAESGAADRAVRQALAEAGARPGDPILPVGYSAGGIVAAGMVADHELNVVGAVNLGGPVASTDLGDVPVLSLEHEEDLIPALGGPGHPSPGLVTASRAALPTAEGAGAELLPAHELARYRETAELVDHSKAPELAAFGDLIRDFTGTASGERTDWRASRVSSGPAAR